MDYSFFVKEGWILWWFWVDWGNIFEEDEEKFCQVDFLWNFRIRLIVEAKNYILIDISTWKIIMKEGS